MNKGMPKIELQRPKINFQRPKMTLRGLNLTFRCQNSTPRVEVQNRTPRAENLLSEAQKLTHRGSKSTSRGSKSTPRGPKLSKIDFQRPKIERMDIFISCVLGIFGMFWGKEGADFQRLSWNHQHLKKKCRGGTTDSLNMLCDWLPE